MSADVYRSAASVMVLRRQKASNGGSSMEFLLLHKPRKSDAWQLPQGGVESGETIAEAALRELKEEAGIDGCRFLGQSNLIYKYDFPPSYRRFRPDNVCGQSISYVFALAPENVSVRVDGQEVDAFIWIDLSQLFAYIKRHEYVSLVVALFGEAQKLVPERQPL